ncbi:MAG: GatB/YqeY domain-containing protein, partial [Gallionellaceae bacterium]|nr:GatB/YqeY domain-containing protein [Gallionellaceae bacterium]
MSLKLKITEDMKTAMRAKETARLGAIRLLLAAMKQREVDERIELSDADILSIIDKMMKQRRDSISQYEAAARQDLADVEKFEMSVLQTYMPQQLSEAEIVTLVDQAIVASGAASPQDMGKVMTILKPQLAGRADVAKVSGLA